MEGKSLRVNVDKTKGIELLLGKKSSVSKVDPCGVCGERVGCASIQYTKCPRWVQVSLLSCCDVFVCRICLGYNGSVEKKLEF